MVIFATATGFSSQGLKQIDKPLSWNIPMSPALSPIEIVRSFDIPNRVAAS